MRQSFLEMSNYLVDRLLEFISNEEKFFKYALQEIKDEKSLIHKDFIEEFEKHGFPKKAAKDWIKSEPKKLELLLNHLKPIFPSIAENYKSILSSQNVSKWIKTGHVNVLKKTISPDIRISIYEKMNYSIKEVPGDNLILGDSAILFKVNGEKRYKTFIDKEDIVLTILLPLSPKRLLIGSVDERGINYDELQTKIASNSLEYFIASNKNEKFLSLQKMVGKEAHLLTEGKIEELVKETFTR